MYKITPKTHYGKELFGAAYCSNDDGSIFAASSILENNTGKVTIYKCNEKCAKEHKIFFDKDLTNVACAMTNTSEDFYFTAITKQQKGVVYTYNIEQDCFELVLTTECVVGNHFGFNDSSIAVSEYGVALAITDIGLFDSEEHGKLTYNCRVLVYNRINSKYVLINSICQEFNEDAVNRRMFGRSLAMTKDGNTLFIGCPDLGFDINKGVRDYNGMHSKVYVYGAENNWKKEITLLPHLSGSSGNFYGTEIELSNDDKRLVIMASGDDEKIGAAYILRYLDGAWIFQQKIQPRAIKMQTKNKLSFYGVAIHNDTIYFSDSLPGKVYKYELQGNRWNRTKTISTPIPKKELFGYDLSISKDGARLFCSSALEHNGSGNGTIYCITDK